MRSQDGRARRREQRERFGHGSNRRRYQLRESLLSIGDDFWIEDDDGERVFHVDGKALRLRRTFRFEDLQGRRLCRSRSATVRPR
jgi:uncharacterized protein YxjI